MRKGGPTGLFLPESLELNVCAWAWVVIGPFSEEG